MSEQPRWKYRFESFERAFALLTKILDQGELSEVERMGLIQSFEITFELAWKTLSDRLKHLGIDAAANPRQVIRQAFSAGVIDDGQTWVNMLDDRNKVSHRYDMENFEEAQDNIRRLYRAALERFRDQFAQDALDQ